MERWSIARISGVIGLVLALVLARDPYQRSSVYAGTSASPEEFMRTVARALLDEAAAKNITVGVLGFVELPTSETGKKDKLGEAAHQHAVSEADDAAEAIRDQVQGMLRGSPDERRVLFIEPDRLRQIKADNRIALEQVRRTGTNQDGADPAATDLGRRAKADVIIEALLAVSDEGPEKLTARIVRLQDNKVAGVIEFVFDEDYRDRRRDAQVKADLMNAMTCLEAYYVDNAKYPETLPAECTRYRSEGVTVTYLKQAGGTYRLSGSHVRGHKVFSLSSGGGYGDITEVKK